MPKPVDLTRSEQMELVRVRKRFVDLCRVLDKKARAAMLAERTELGLRMQELGMERSEIVALSTDDGKLDGIKVVTLDRGRKNLERWANAGASGDGGTGDMAGAGAKV